MLLDILTQIVPKALLPISVLIIGFLIIAVSMLLTKIFVKIFNKFKDNKKKQ